MMAIKAIDRDEGRNGYVEYMLESNSSSPAALPFTLGSVDGLLRVSGRLDRELKANYELTVTARDRGEPPKSTQAKILVKILDENDNSPVFDPKHYSASIAENASIGASVLQVSSKFHMKFQKHFEILFQFSMQISTSRSQLQTLTKELTVAFVSLSPMAMIIVTLA